MLHFDVENALNEACNYAYSTGMNINKNRIEKAKAYRKLEQERKEEILEEFKRLQWHYIKNDNFPEINKEGFINVVTEELDGVWQVETYTERDKEFWIDDIVKWRYVE